MRIAASAQERDVSRQVRVPVTLLPAVVKPQRLSLDNLVVNEHP
jgi:hypothetical protein